MELGIDVSSYLEVLDAKGKFFRDGKEIDPLDEFVKNNVKQMRIRLWNNPYSEHGDKYLGGTCDLSNLLKLAKLSQKKGFSIYLDIHYSDFWADPAKQFKPKAWRDLHGEDLLNAVYEFTKSTLQTIKENGIDLKMIQVGNEITNGFLWPDGKLIDNQDGPRSNYEFFSSLLKQGFKACEVLFPNALKMIHLEKSYDKTIYKEFFENMEKYGVKYDVIGASYYPYWHGTTEQLFDNLNYCKNRFKKKIVIAELAYAFTMDDYLKDSDHGNNLAINKESFPNELPFPITKDGQAAFLSDFLDKAERNEVYQVYYWEPLWVPGKLTCWASESGQEYINEKKKSTRNEWANQCLVDYEGNLNPSFDKYKI